MKEGQKARPQNWEVCATLLWMVGGFFNVPQCYLWTAFSKPAGCRLNELPPLEVWPSPFLAENILFLFYYRQGTEKAEKTPKKKLPNNKLKVSMPTIFTLKFLKTQTSFRSFFNYKSGNIHRFYRSIGKKMSLSRQAFDWQSEVTYLDL